MVLKLEISYSMTKDVFTLKLHLTLKTLIEKQLKVIKIILLKLIILFSMSLNYLMTCLFLKYNTVRGQHLELQSYINEII
jgi:hypothetical protein